VSDLRLAAGPLAVLVAVVAGIHVGVRRGPGGAAVLLAFAILLALAGIWRRGRTGLVCALLAGGLGGAATTQRALHGLAVSPIGAPAAVRAPVVATLTLVGDPEPGRFDVRAIARVHSMQVPAPRDGGGRLVIATASRDAGSRLALLEAGERVVVRGRLRVLQGYDARYRWRHVVARLVVNEVMRVERAGAVLPRLANPVRRTVLGGARFLPPTERALVSGFLVGDTRAVPGRITDEFRAAGLSHLLAVSGQNVAFVIALAGPLLRRLPLAGRFVGGLAVILLFGSITRWEPSVLRASAMAAVSMLAIFLGRPVPTLRVLTLAATALLLADPFLVRSVGFQLSCGACAGLVLLGQPLAAHLPGPDVLRMPLGTTAAAQIGVLPVALGTFGTLPLIALPANVAVAPVVGPLTTAGLIGGAVGGVLASGAPGLAALCQLPARFLVGYVEAVASVASRVPLAVEVRSFFLLLAIVCAGAALVVATRRPGSVRRNARVPPR
jgi:competence protein ComEC